MVVVSMSIGMGVVGLVASLLVVALFVAKVSLKLVFSLFGSRDNQVMVGMVGQLMSRSVSGLKGELADESLASVLVDHRGCMGVFVLVLLLLVVVAPHGDKVVEELLL